MLVSGSIDVEHLCLALEQENPIERHLRKHGNVMVHTEPADRTRVQPLQPCPRCALRVAVEHSVKNREQTDELPRRPAPKKSREPEDKPNPEHGAALPLAEPGHGPSLSRHVNQCQSPATQSRVCIQDKRRLSRNAWK